jgi:hypothetical protein
MFGRSPDGAGDPDRAEKDRLERAAPLPVIDVHDGTGWRPADADQCTVEAPEVMQCRLHEHVRRHRIRVVARYADRAINTAQALGCSSRVKRGQPGYDPRSLGDQLLRSGVAEPCASARQQIGAVAHA